MKDRFELFVTTINQIYRNLHRIKKREMEELDLKGSYLMCLYHMAKHPDGLTVTELSELCDEDKAAISRTVAELSQRGYAVIENTQKYRAPVKLTEAGQKVSIRISKIVEKAVVAGSEKLSESERIAFYKALLQISRNLQKYLISEE